MMNRVKQKNINFVFANHKPNLLWEKEILKLNVAKLPAALTEKPDRDQTKKTKQLKKLSF